MNNFNSYNAKDIKEQVSLVDLLARLGFKPARSSGKEQMYLSMIRDSDTSPSFAVNDKLNVWYDHGLGKGGNVIDFGLLYWPQLSFPEVLEKIINVAAWPVSPVTTGIEGRAKRRHALKIPHYKVEDIKELGTNPVITGYLEQRGIYAQAQNRMKEIYYFVEDEKKVRKQFFAAGWQNELGSWEVRNQHFKGCLGPKAISFIPGHEAKLSVFEGFINYLSWLTDNPCAADSILVLNSVTLVFPAAKKAAGFPHVDLYFDRDTAGRNAALDFAKHITHAVDCSWVYEGHDDYNDMIVSRLHSNRLLNTGIAAAWR